MTDGAELLRAAATGIAPGPPPIDAVVARGRRRRGRRRVGLAMAAIVAVTVGAGATQLLERVPGRDVDVIARVANPAPVPWWSDGELHLRRLVVTAPDLAGLVVVPDGVVYSDEQGSVTHVTDEGREVRIGTGVSAGQLASDAATGRVAWVDAHLEDRALAPELIVYDTSEGREVARRDLTRRGPRWEVLDEGDHPIAVEGDTVWYADQDGDYSWQPNQGDPVRVTGPDTYLLDTAAGSTLMRYADADTRGIYQPTWIDPGVLPAGEVLSDDGQWALGSDGANRARLFHGEDPQPTGLPKAALVQDYAFGPGVVVYAVSDRSASDWRSEDFIRAFGGPYDIVVCRLATAECDTVAEKLDGLVTLPNG